MFISSRIRSEDKTKQGVDTETDLKLIYRGLRIYVYGKRRTAEMTTRAVFSFLVKLGSFGLASTNRIIFALISSVYQFF